MRVIGGTSFITNSTIFIISSLFKKIKKKILKLNPKKKKLKLSKQTKKHPILILIISIFLNKSKKKPCCCLQEISQKIFPPPKMNTLLLTVIFLMNVLFVSNDSNSEYDYLVDKSKKFNTISYDKILHDSHIKLQKTLKYISKNQNKMVISVENLLFLIENDIITSKQAESIWGYLILNSESPELPQIHERNYRTAKNELIKENLNTETFESTQQINKNRNSFVPEEKRSFSFYQMMVLIILGYIIVVFFILIIFAALYQRETYILLCFASVFLSYNFLSYARILKFQLNADFVPSLFFNSSFCLTNLILHSIMIKLKLEKKMTNWTDIFLVDETFKAKFIHSLINIFVGYNLAFSCHSGIIQIPFFFSIYYSFYLMSCRLENLINKRFWPCWLFVLSMLALFLMHYIYRFGKKSFVFVTNKYGEEPDFQFIGYCFSGLVLNTLFPVYLYIQHQNLWKIYNSNEFSYKLVFKKFREEISQDVLVFNYNMFFYHLYAIMIIFLIYFGLKIKMFLMVVIPSFALQSYMGFIVKDERILWVIFFYAGSLYVLNSVYLLGKMEDKLSMTVNFFLFIPLLKKGYWRI